jgi:sugar/nucleoside kinase (ribokinase family)
VLFGLTHGHDIATCARLGSVCAGEVIAHFGPRPQADLRQLVKPLL